MLYEQNSAACFASLFVVTLLLQTGNGDGSADDTPTPHSIFQRNSSFWCPTECVCSMQEKIIDCSSQGLQRVPSLPLSTNRLYLHNNLLTRLEQDDFQFLSQLTYLILGGNRIKDLDWSVLRDLHSLKYLILDGNKISELSSMAFQDLTDLETISLARNQLEMLPGDLFVNNTQLTLINFQGNGIHSVHKDAFKGLHHLTMLNLEGNQLDQDVFEALQGHRHLTTLRMNGNRIRRLPSGGLSLNSLKHLALHSNEITMLPQVLLRNCSSLEILTLNQNAIEVMNESLFTGCSSLAKLHLQKNRLKEVVPGTFSDTRSLKEIYLCDNQLKHVAPRLFHKLDQLVSVHLERNEISFIAKDTFVGLQMLEAIYLHHNSISQIQPGAFADLPCLKYLVLYKNNIRIIHPSVLIPLHSLQKIQVDPFKCSCSLLPLVTWLKSKNLNGISCIHDSGKVLAVTSLRELCHGLKASKPEIKREMKREVKPTVHPPQFKVDIFQHVLAAPRGPSVHPSKEQKLNQRINQLEKTVAELQYKVFRLEGLLAGESYSCRRTVCLYYGVRFLAGDKWRSEEAGFCSCLHDGTVNCS